MKRWHLFPIDKGRWSIRKFGSVRAYRIFDTKQKAMMGLRVVKRNKEMMLYIHTNYGTVKAKRLW